MLFIDAPLTPEAFLRELRKEAARLDAESNATDDQDWEAVVSAEAAAVHDIASTFEEFVVPGCKPPAVETPPAQPSGLSDDQLIELGRTYERQLLLDWCRLVWSQVPLLLHPFLQHSITEAQKRMDAARNASTSQPVAP